MTATSTEVAEAEAAAADIEKAIRNGDPAVTIDDLNAAEGRLRVATLRAEGATAQEADEIERTRVGRIDELRREIDEQMGARRLAGVLARFEAVVVELTGLAGDVAAYNRDLEALRAELVDLVPLPRAVVFSDYVDTGRGGPPVYPIDAARLLAEAGWRAAEAVAPSTGAELAAAAGIFSQGQPDGGPLRMCGLSDVLTDRLAHTTQAEEARS